MPGEEQQQHQGGGSTQHSNLKCTLLDENTEPGAYVCPKTGDLIRVVRTGASSREAELLEKHGTDPIYATLISRDPFIPITRARMAAANLDVEINF